MTVRYTVSRIVMTLLLLIGAAVGAMAQNTDTYFYTPGGGGVNGAVGMCLNSSNKAVPCNASGVQPSPVTSGGYDVNLTSTPTVQNAAYSSGNAIGGLQTIAFFRNAGSSGILNNLSVWSKGGSTTAITLYIFGSNPSGSTCTDKSAFSLAVADISKLVAAIPPVLTPAVVGAGTTATTASQQSPISVKNGDSTVNLYVCAVVGGSVTPATTTDLVFDYAGVQD